MSSNVEERIQYLQELGQFMGTAQGLVKNAAERLGWTLNVFKNNVCKPGPMVTCPLIPGHRVVKDRLLEHLQVCKWKSEGYLEEDVALPLSCTDSDRFGTKSIAIDSELAEKIIRRAAEQDSTMITVEDIMLCVTRLGLGALRTGYGPIPQTSDRIISAFTTDERRAMYDYVISQTGAVESVKLEDLQLPFALEKKNEPKSKLELMAEERDAKRRRISYRNKKVSTNRKSHTEVIREVIQNQMEMYETWLKKDIEVNEEEDGSEGLYRPVKQECQDDEYEKESGKEQYGNRSRTISDLDDRQSQRDQSLGPSRNSYASTSRDEYERDRVKDTDSKYDGNYHRHRPRESGRSHRREYSHDYRNRSRDRHRSSRHEKEYRDRESRGSRDRYHERDSKRRDKGEIHKHRNDRRERSPTKEERNSKYKNPDGNKDILHSDNQCESHVMRGNDVDEGYQKYSQTEEYRIFEDMQRLLDAQVTVDVKRENRSSSGSLSNENEGKAVGTSFESGDALCKNEDLSDDSVEDFTHKKRSHKQKKGKKHKHKRKKHSKKSKGGDSSSSNDGTHSSDFSC